MSTLKEKIQQDLMQSMKEKASVKVGALRMLKAAIMKWEVAGAKKEASDEVIVEIVGREIKQRRDAASQYRTGGREELAEKEEAEIAVLKGYLPEQMSEKEVRVVVKTVISEIGARSQADFGRVMGAVMPKVKGRSDGALVKQVVEECLS